MAERNQLKIADQPDIADDDPFAELTRIMGFDPRQQAGATEAPQPDPIASPVERAAASFDAAADDDFGIDLEKEMMGDHGSDDGAGVFPQPAGSPSPTESEASAGKAAMPDLELDFGEGFDAAAEASLAGDAEEDEIREPEADAAWGQLDIASLQAAHPAHEAVAAEAAPIEDEPVEGEPAPAEEFADDFDVAMADVAGSDFSPEAISGQAAGHRDREDADEDQLAEATPADDFDMATVADVGSDFSPVAVSGQTAGHGDREEDPVELDLDLDELQLEAQAAPHAQDDPWTVEPDGSVAEAEVVAASAEAELSQPEPSVAPAIPAPGLFDADEFRLGANDARADDVDLDLDLDPSALFDADELLGEEELHLEGEPRIDDSEFQVDADELARDIAVDVQQSEPPFAPAPPPLTAAPPPYEAKRPSFMPAQEPRAAVTQEPQATAAEFSFEDELNALLGNIAPKKAKAPETPAPYEAKDRFEPAAVSPVDDLQWDLDDLQPVAESASAQQTEPDEYFQDMMPKEATRPAGQRYAWPAEPASESTDELPDFDDDAFAAALADGFDEAGHETRQPAAAEPVRTAEAGRRKEDPLDVIAALAAQYSASLPGSHGRAGAASKASASAQRQSDSDDFDFPIAAFDEAPNVETVDVADQAVALADDLDIPELDFQDEPPVAALDDLDAEFANLLNDMNAGETADPRRATLGRNYANDGGIVGEWDAAAVQAAPAHEAYEDDLGQYLDVDNLPGSQPLEAGYGADDYDFDAGSDEAIAAPLEVEPRTQRRGLFVAAIVGLVAIAGGVGAFTLSSGEGGANVPAIVKADGSPVKVKPENPGGTTVPNQDSKVYETVAGADAGAEPQQEQLVTTAEEPIDVAPPVPQPSALDLTPAEGEETAVAQPKGEDRIEQILQEAEEVDADREVAAIAPRKVRTMIVRPDGTLVPREDPEPAPAIAAPEAAAPAGEGSEAPALPEATASVPSAAEPSAPVAAEAPAATEVTPAAVETPPAVAEAPPAATETPIVAEAPAIAETPAEAETPAAAETPAVASAEPTTAASSVTTPDTVPVAPQRPAEQTVDVVGEVKADKVAAVQPEPAAVAPKPAAVAPKPAAVAPKTAAVAPKPAAVAPVPTVAAPAAGGATIWSMQIASQPSEAAARSSYQDLASRYGGVLAGREVNIVKAEISGRGTFWRVRVPAKSRNDAISLCENYKAAGGNCFVSR